MNQDQLDAALEERRLKAKLLVSELGSAELFVLAGLANGMSRNAIGAAFAHSLEDVELAIASLMKKLSAETIADAVRIAIYANVSWRD